jgi:aminoglycoside phosphotransferase (APT) family kinase protein
MKATSVSADGIPAPSGVQVLSAIRFNLNERLAPELSSTMAQHICRMAQQLIGNLILMETEGPKILARQIARQSNALRDGTQILLEHGLADPALVAEAADIAKTPKSGSEPRLELEQRNRRVNALLEQILPKLYSLACKTKRADIVSRVNSLIREIIDAYADTERDNKKAEQSSIAAYAAEAGTHAVITSDRLEQYLRRKFSDRPAIRVGNLHELAGGFGKMTLLFDVEGLEGKTASLVMRRDRPNGATDTTVANEFPLLVEMKRCGLPVAEPLWLEDSAALDYPFVVVRRLEGQPGGDLWRPDPAICTANTARDIARILARLHALDPSKLKLGPALQSDGNPENSVRAMVAHIRELWMRKRLEPDAVLEASLGWLENNIPPAPPKICVIHSDVGFHNLLVKDEKISGLLDWELAHLGDPVEDLSYVRPYIEQLMPWNEFLSEYRNAGGSQYSEEVANYYFVWRGVRNMVYSILCHHAFCTDANLDLRFGHTGVYNLKLILLEAANKVAQLGIQAPKP